MVGLARLVVSSRSPSSTGLPGPITSSDEIPDVLRVILCDSMYLVLYFTQTKSKTTVFVHCIKEGRNTLIRKEVALGKVLELLAKEHPDPCAYEAHFQA